MCRFFCVFSVWLFHHFAYTIVLCMCVGINVWFVFKLIVYYTCANKNENENDTNKCGKKVTFIVDETERERDRNTTIDREKRRGSRNKKMIAIKCNIICVWLAFYIPLCFLSFYGHSVYIKIACCQKNCFF